MSQVFLNPDDDPAMEVASQRARDTFRYFWREQTWEYRRIVPGLEGSAIKAAFSDPEPGARVEHMWLGDVMFDGATVSGRLLNSPNWVRSVAAGDTAQVPLAQLGDWMYSMRGRCYGAHTVNLMRSRMGADERREHDAAWGYDFGDPNDVQVIPSAAERAPKKKKKLFGRSKPAETEAAVDLNAEHPMALNMAEAYEQQLRQDAQGILGYRDPRGFMPLHDMALAGATTAVQLMLNHGADPRELTGHGWSAAQLAYSLGWHDTVALLQQHGG